MYTHTDGALPPLVRGVTVTVTDAISAPAPASFDGVTTNMYCAGVVGTPVMEQSLFRVRPVGKAPVLTLQAVTAFVQLDTTQATAVPAGTLVVVRPL